MKFSEWSTYEIAPKGLRWPWSTLYVVDIEVGTGAPRIIDRGGNECTVELTAKANGVTKQRVGIRRWWKHITRKLRRRA